MRSGGLRIHKFGLRYHRKLSIQLILTGYRTENYMNSFKSIHTDPKQEAQTVLNLTSFVNMTHVKKDVKHV